MKNITVISYPAPRNESLLSLTELRSRYMVPFAGRFRIVDFTLRNVYAVKAKNTIIYNNMLDDLEVYVQNHPHVKNSENNIIPLISENLTIDQCADILEKNATAYYILYNGDIPSIIDFDDIFNKYQKLNSNSVLFKLKYENKSSMANTVLVTNRKSLFSIVKKAQKDNSASPNVFEMIINMLIIKGIKQSTINAFYKQVNNIPDYYNSNMEIFKNKVLSSLIFHDPYMKSGIHVKSYAQVDQNALIKDSFISDGCIIEGKVENSIVFPGVYVASNSIIRNSILLPYVTIGKGANVENVVIDEYTDHYKSFIEYNVNSKVRIGSDLQNFKNSNYPKSIFASITLVGKNCYIPEEVTIGSACYIPSGSGVERFATKKVLHDGLSLE